MWIWCSGALSTFVAVQVRSCWLLDLDIIEFAPLFVKKDPSRYVLVWSPTIFLWVQLSVFKWQREEFFQERCNLHKVPGLVEFKLHTSTIATQYCTPSFFHLCNICSTGQSLYIHLAFRLAIIFNFITQGLGKTPTLSPHVMTTTDATLKVAFAFFSGWNNILVSADISITNFGWPSAYLSWCYWPHQIPFLNILRETPP